MSDNTARITPTLAVVPSSGDSSHITNELSSFQMVDINDPALINSAEIATTSAVQAEAVSTTDASNSEAEEVAEEVVQKVSEKLDTQEGEDELKDDIEESVVDEDEMEDVDKVVDDLTEGALEAEVVGVSSGEDVVVETQDGSRIEAKLENNEDYAVYMNDKGETVILIDENLSEDEAAAVTSDALADIVVEVADENGVELSDDFAGTFESGFMSSVLYSMEVWNHMIGGKDIYVQIAEVTGETEDEMTAREIAERQAVAENHTRWRRLS